MSTLVTQNIKDLIGDKNDFTNLGIYIGISDEAHLLLNPCTKKMPHPKRNWLKLGSLGEGRCFKITKVETDASALTASINGGMSFQSHMNLMRKNNDECLVLGPKHDLISKVNNG